MERVEMQFAMGVDPSLVSTGLILLDEAGNLAHRQRITSQPSGPLVEQRMRRYADIVSPIKDAFRKFEPLVVCIEGYSFGSQTQGVMDRVEMGCLLRYSLLSLGARIVEVPPTTLKKWATGKGAFPGGGKTPLIAEITKRYGVQLTTDDEYDGYALARLAMQIAEFEAPATEYQREAVAVALHGKTKKTPKRKRVVA